MAQPPEVDPFRANLHVRAAMQPSAPQPTSRVDVDPWARKPSLGFDDVFGSEKVTAQEPVVPMGDVDNRWWNAYSHDIVSDEYGHS